MRRTMARENTNKHYSLRKLKKGTASVAVALTVLGAGLASQTEVKAEGSSTQLYDNWNWNTQLNRTSELGNKLRNLETSVSNLEDLMNSLQSDIHPDKLKGYSIGQMAEYLKALNDHFEKYYEEVVGDDSRRVLAKELEKNRELNEKLSELSTTSQALAKELQEQKENYDLVKTVHADTVKKHEEYVRNIAKVLEDRVHERNSLQEELAKAQQALTDAQQALAQKQEEFKEELAKKQQELEKEKLAKEGIIDSTSVYVQEKEAEVKTLTDSLAAKEAEVKTLTENLAAKEAEIQEKEAERARQENMYETFMSQYKETVEKQKEELAKLKQLETINNNLLGNAKDMIAKLSAKNEQLASDKAKLEEQNKISDASRQGLRRDLNASREAKKQLEAEHQKLEEQNKISEASRKGLRRDLDASREAKKQVEKALEEANSKLAALEKLNKELEESKKLTEKEKAELQAKLEAEAKALKEKLAKQAEELAKLRAGKASDSQTPEATPGNKVVPGKGQAPQAGTKPNQNKEPMKETKRQLPSTGEATNPFFTAAALAVMATAGVAAVAKRKEEN
uniref:M protein n=1 Tax=Streptococcus dysgalactiae subsp. equisimilis TaxID=119602 RepID=W0T3X9_STREQ|nr:M protein [Streptococcus dysgalactiae subsp. equisimilis]